MSAPLTPEREATIRRIRDDRMRSEVDLDDALDDVLAELDRLRAELAALPAPVVETAFRDALGNVWPLGHFPAETEAQVLKTTPTIQRTVRISEWTEDPCHPCGCPKRFNRHADGCTVEPDDDMSNADVFTASELYEMDRDDEFMYDAADDARDEDGAS